MAMIVARSNYKDERKCPVCKKIVKPSCKGHKGIPYSVFRMIEIKLNIKKKKYSLEAKILKAHDKVVERKVKQPELNHSAKRLLNKLQERKDYKFEFNFNTYDSELKKDMPSWMH